MINLLSTVSIILLFNLGIFHFFEFLKNKINVFDYPDDKKKLHSHPVPLMGGWIFMLNLIFFLFLIYMDIIYLSYIEMNIIICSSVFLLTGILDDKYNLSPYTKFLTLTIILLVFFFFTDKIILNSIELYSFQINFGNYLSLLFSILCVLLFVNAFNLFDGINLQNSLYGLYLLVYLLVIGKFSEIIFFLIMPLLLIIFLNSRNKLFMGDSGTLFLGSLISLMVIKNYNIEKLVSVDEIFLLMILPGLDMLRLFIERIVNKKNPFMGDREHLHHYFLHFYNYKISIASIIFIALFPSILNFFISSQYIIGLFLIFYLMLIYFFKKKLNNKII
tara:strand:+ start:399 stop:1394 length:996 start_codon:yes stop_codon:yes gene_type:complete